MLHSFFVALAVSYSGVVLPTDCGNDGYNKIIAFDNGAGQTWQRTNTSRWCAPRGGMPVADDPTFEGSN